MISLLTPLTASMTSLSKGLMKILSSFVNSACSNDSVKSMMALADSEMLVVAFIRDLRDTVDLWVKLLLSLGFEFTVKSRSLIKGLLNRSLTFVLPNPT